MVLVWLFVLLALCNVRVLWANDGSIVGVGGSARMLKGEHRDVQMESETVWIEIWPTEYVTTADFIFVNHGPAQKVQMGFPESGGGDVAQGYEKRSAFKWFATWVDDGWVQAKRLPVSPYDEAYRTCLQLNEECYFTCLMAYITD